MEDAGVGPIRALTSRVISATVAPCTRYASASMIASRTAPGFLLDGSEYFIYRTIDVWTSLLQAQNPQGVSK